MAKNNFLAAAKAQNRPVDTPSAALPSNLSQSTDDEVAVAMSERVIDIPLVDIDVLPQVRKKKGFDQNSIDALAESIRQFELQQPILVRPLRGRYVLVSGERRLRAHRRLGRSTIPSIVRNLTQQQALQIQIIENIQREDNSLFETQAAMVALRDELKLTNSQIGAVIGKSVTYVSRLLNISKMPEDYEDALLEVQDPLWLRYFGEVYDQHNEITDYVIETLNSEIGLPSRNLVIRVRDDKQLQMDIVGFIKGLSSGDERPPLEQIVSSLRESSVMPNKVSKAAVKSQSDGDKSNEDKRFRPVKFNSLYNKMKFRIIETEDTPITIELEDGTTTTVPLSELVKTTNIEK